MASASNDSRYLELLDAIKTMHVGDVDALGRPRHEHFERVVQRLLSRNPAANRTQVEAAMLHDVMTHERGGRAFLDKLDVGEDTVDLLARIIPPPNANYYQDLERFTLADNAVYLSYIEGLVLSGDRGAVAVKLADVEDTLDSLRRVGSEAALKQLQRQYEPSRLLLEAGLTRLSDRL